MVWPNRRSFRGHYLALLLLHPLTTSLVGPPPGSSPLTPWPAMATTFKIFEEHGLTSTDELAAFRNFVASFLDHVDETSYVQNRLTALLVGPSGTGHHDQPDLSSPSVGIVHTAAGSPVNATGPGNPLHGGSNSRPDGEHSSGRTVRPCHTAHAPCPPRACPSSFALSLS